MWDEDAAEVRWVCSFDTTENDVIEFANLLRQNYVRRWIEKLLPRKTEVLHLYIPELNEHYHSIHGAIQESIHIFIKAGIEYYGQKNIRVLEAGFERD